MKVKIGNRVYDSNIEPIMIVLSDSDKDNIKNMHKDATKYCSYPESINDVSVITEFMNIPDYVGKEVNINFNGDIKMESKWRKFTTDSKFTILRKTKKGLYEIMDEDGNIHYLRKRNINGI